MDRLFRLICLLPLLGALLWSCSQSARAQTIQPCSPLHSGYECTAKVTSTNPVPKQNTLETGLAGACRTAGAGVTSCTSSPFYSTQGAACGVTGFTGYSNCGGCPAAFGGWDGCGSCGCVVSGSVAFNYQAHWYWPSTNTDAGLLTSGTAPTRTIQVCPSGTVENGGQCYPQECPSTFTAYAGNQQQCERPETCAYPKSFKDGVCGCQSGLLPQVVSAGSGGWGSTGEAVWTQQGGNAPTSACYTSGPSEVNGCTVQREGCSQNAGLLWTCFGNYLTGTTCATSGAQGTPTDANSTTPDDPSVTCIKSGGTWGQVNGVDTCLAKGTGGTTSTVKPPVVTEKIVNNADGTSTKTTTTETTTTTCTNGSCNSTTTTTTVVTNYTGPNGTGTASSGSGSGTQTQTGGGGNGNGTGAGAESSFGGSCSAGFACDGDAVVCAIALEQYKRNCQLLTAAGGTSTAQAVSKFDSVIGSNNQELNAQPASFGSLNSSTFLAGTCMPDLVTTIAGHSFVVPFSSLCSYLSYAGMAFMAVCGIIAFGIVSRGAMA